MKAIKEREKKKVSVIAVDEQELRSHVSEVVRQSIEETLNGLFEAERLLAHMNDTRNTPLPTCNHPRLRGRYRGV